MKVKEDQTGPTALTVKKPCRKNKEKLIVYLIKNKLLDK